MPITVLQSNNTGDIATIIKGINYAKNNGANVLNMSLGTYSYTVALEQALAQAYQTMVIVTAAGNDASAIDSKCALPLEYFHAMFPAAFSFVLGAQATKVKNYSFKKYLCDYSNYDCDGPSFSQFGEGSLYNYELAAPGDTIYSTVPNGMYRKYNGTSMSAPLISGGISVLLHAKNYPSQEMLFGDLINTTNEYEHVNFFAAYNAGEAPAQLQFVSYTMMDTVVGDADNIADVGEIIDFYPIIRTTWGATDSITCWMETREFEDTSSIRFINNHVDFGQALSAYAKARSINPIRVQINDSLVDGRIICLNLCAISPNAQDTLRHPIDLNTENCVELYGMINQNTTLYPNVNYVVTNNLVIPDNVTLTIKPGTTLKFREGIGLSIALNAKIIANGTADSMITFTKANMTEYWDGINLSTFYYSLKYCIIEYANKIFPNNFRNIYYISSLQNLIVRQNINHYAEYLNYASYVNDYENTFLSSGSVYNGKYNNIINDTYKYYAFYPNAIIIAPCPYQNNIFNISQYSSSNNNSQTTGYCIGASMYNINTYNIEGMYLGTSKEFIARQYIYDINTPNSISFSEIDISNMPLRPHKECHGIVWKVLVNGFDAQDEFDSIVPLGIGRHRFDVYFNRAMNTSMTPSLTIGIRAPYTQYNIGADGSWSSDSTIYTVYLDLDGATMDDGLYRIYVSHAQDDEYFDIPDEKTRFNVPISAAGSMSANFMASGKAGRIELEWNNNEVDFNDFLGYNMYRYQANSDTIQINTTLINDTMYTDFNVIQNERYYYFYKVMRTDLSESDKSTIVSATPQSSILGDANGDLTVNILDVISVISYISNQQPQPFVFDAADVNGDGIINLLDIVGIINIISNQGVSTSQESCASATYFTDNGILYINSPVELGGLQIKFSNANNQNFQTSSTLNGFEKITNKQTDSTYFFMSYSMSNKIISAGIHPILQIGEASIDNIILSDPRGCNIVALNANNSIGSAESDFQIQVKNPYPNPFNNSLQIPYLVGSKKVNNLEFYIIDITGRVMDHINIGNIQRGEHLFTWKPNNNLKNGIYFIKTTIDGITVQTSKVIFFK